MFKKIMAGFDQAINVLAYIALGFIIIPFLVTVLEVCTRFFLDLPLDWTIEVTGFSIALLTFLGVVWVLKKEGHVSIDFLSYNLKPKNVILLRSITSFVSALVCLVVVWYSAAMVWDFYQRGMRFVTELRPFQAPFLVVIPLSFLMLFIQFLRRAYHNWEKWRGVAEEEDKQQAAGIQQEL